MTDVDMQLHACAGPLRDSGQLPRQLATVAMPVHKSRQTHAHMFITEVAHRCAETQSQNPRSQLRCISQGADITLVSLPRHTGQLLLC